MGVGTYLIQCNIVLLCFFLFFFLAVVAGMKKPNDHAEPTKSNAKKNGLLC